MIVTTKELIRRSGADTVSGIPLNHSFHAPALPQALAKLPTWLVWRLMPAEPGRKPPKIPYYASGKVREGGQGTPEDLGSLVSLDRACAVVSSRNKYTGVGLAMIASNGIVGLDFDDCVLDGVVDPRVLGVLQGTYAEFSPSGSGVRAFFLGSLPDRKDIKAEVSLEVFHGSGYLTVTGNVLPGWSAWGWDRQVAPLNDTIRRLYENYFGQGSSTGGSSANDENWIASPPIGLSIEQATAMLGAMDPNCSYQEWIWAGQALHHEFGGSAASLEIWREWSKRYTTGPDGKSNAYVGDDVVDTKWSGFGRFRGRPITAAYLLKHGKVAQVAARYEGLREWKARVVAAVDDFELREKVCAEIARDDRLTDIEREALAADLKDRFWNLNIKLPLGQIRKLIAPPEVHIPVVRMARPLTEFGMMERMLDQWGSTLMYVPEMAQWHVWTGVYWRATTRVEIEWYAKETIRELPKEAGQHRDAGAFFEFCALCQQVRMVHNMIALAVSDPRVMVPAENLDQKPGLLCVQNGVVDLRTGELRVPDPSLRITKCCSTNYRPGAAAEAKLWKQTLLDVFSNDMELVDFFQRLIGYTAMGDPTLDMMVIPHGNGSNGKSTVLGIIRRMFGSYARAAEAGTFVADSKMGASAGGPREDLVRLKGARMVYVNEPDENGELREGAVKSMSGGDAITARGVHALASIEIMPSWVVFLPTNHKPIVKGSDTGIWRRLTLIPFLRNFESDIWIAKDPDRESKLAGELEGVLAWCVEGAMLYFGQGLAQPSCVKAAREAYRSDMDLLAEWLDECCDVGEGYMERSNNLWKSWEFFAKERGLLTYIKNATSLSRKLDSRFPAARDSDGTRLRRGIRLRDGGQTEKSVIDAFD
jgi:P4 family phage/plasmid primase-like protien